MLGEFHGQKSLVGYSQWGHKESDTTERLHFTSLLGRKVMTNLDHLDNDLRTSKKYHFDYLVYTVDYERVSSLR